VGNLSEKKVKERPLCFAVSRRDPKLFQITSER